MKGDLPGNSKSVIYLIICDKCKDEYIGLAVDFKPCSRVHKSDLKKKKERCGTSRCLNANCLCSTSSFGYVKVQIIEQVYSKDPSKLKKCFGEEKDAGKFSDSQLPIG